MLPNKIMIGSPKGSPIVLAPPNDLLAMCIAEGIEDALSAHEATGLGAWAAGSASLMPALADAVPGYIDCVSILAHRDPAGIKGANELATRLSARGIGCVVAFLGIGDGSMKDANDILRASGPDELRRRFDSALVNGRQPLPVPPNGAAKPTTSAEIIRVSSVQAQPIKWLWPSRMALGKVTMVAGNPGLGKSQFTTYLAAQVSTGGKWPAREGNSPTWQRLDVICRR